MSGPGQGDGGYSGIPMGRMFFVTEFKLNKRITLSLPVDTGLCFGLESIFPGTSSRSVNYS